MKSRFLTIFVSLTALALSASLVLAQGPRGEGRKGPGGGLARSLDLTDAQKTQIEAIRQEAETQSKNLQEMLRTDNSALTDAVKANNTGLITTLTQRIGGTQGQLLAIRANAGAKIYALLTPEQKSKLGDRVGILYGGPGAGPGPRFGRQ
jgi:Spy/CpxP family protein refolding chaperone